MGKTPIIQVEELTRKYQMGESIVHALRGVSFQVQKGEFVALMGSSGSGKSTLMHLLGCLDTPSAGSYFLNGQDVSRLSKQQMATVRNRQIGFVFQTFNLLPRLNAKANVMMPLLYRGRDSHVDEQASEALSWVGLANRAKHRPSELSGGQRQRVAIARALVTNPAIILADEPTGNLDSQTGAEIMQLLGQLNQQPITKENDSQEARTIILVTHDSQVAQYAHRILHMQDGEIVNG
jgi:putative ABC transport system ATP-binding protein